jgi:hypothetical protein
MISVSTPNRQMRTTIDAISQELKDGDKMKTGTMLGTSQDRADNQIELGIGLHQKSALKVVGFKERDQPMERKSTVNLKGAVLFPLSLSPTKRSEANRESTDNHGVCHPTLERLSPNTKAFYPTRNLSPNTELCH